MFFENIAPTRHNLILILLLFEYTCFFILPQAIKTTTIMSSNRLYYTWIKNTLLKTYVELVVDT